MTKKELLRVIREAARDRRASLYLGQRGLTALPAEIGQVPALRELYLGGNKLTALPAEIGQLSALQRLHLNDNGLTALPAEIGQLPALESLDLSHNELTALPAEIGQLSALQFLGLSFNKLTALPAEIGQLSALESLGLGSNKLTALPAEIGQLPALEFLDLSFNKLTALPAEIGQLSALRSLWLHGNKLTALPTEIGQLFALEFLHLSNNELTAVPAEIGQLSALKALLLERNPGLVFPPPEIVEQGTAAVLTFLRKYLEDSRRQWVSKVLVLGEGGVGKTSLLRALAGEPLDQQESTTHGIEIRPLEFSHPSEPRVTMQLNAWDFGGQEIYHATHQFFLTERSLFVLVWNARHGYEQGKLYYWLDAVQARAPQSPVLIVAAFIDQRDADLPLADIQRKYPQVVGHYAVSNRDGTGMEELRAAIAAAAAGLPLMGERWPGQWLAAANAVRQRPDNFIAPAELRRLMAAHGVVGKDQDILARWLHELGDTLYFQDDPGLNDMVILKPPWVISEIDRVLESEEVIAKAGVFTRCHMEKLWSGVTPQVRDHFLRLMEKYDLSYRTPEDEEISLVVERLPLDPADFEKSWEAVKQAEGCTEVAMRFLLGSTLPAGMPTWFIARSHRFTTHTHWRLGALFADGPERNHLALVQAFPHHRYIELRVRGPFPHNFFALLRDGLELTVARFPGLKVERLVPCPGHDGAACEYEFALDNLQRAIKRERPVLEIQCQRGLEDVSVPLLLFGIDWNAKDELLRRLDEILAGQDEQVQGLKDLTELTQRQFLNIFHREQASVDSHCPNIFVLRPAGALIETVTGRHGETQIAEWLSKLGWQKLELHLVCQQPGCWHLTERGAYEVTQYPRLLRAALPYMKGMLQVLKYALPVVGIAFAVTDKTLGPLLKDDVSFMADLVHGLSGSVEAAEPVDAGLCALPDAPGFIEAEGAGLRALRILLDHLDPQQNWGGLTKVLTLEGHYLWLCPRHAAEFRRR
jgi:hypothetical protein